MAAICHFCDREFANAQAVRAHLKSCGAYQGQHAHASASGRGSLGNASSIGRARPSGRDDAGPHDESGSDLVRQLEKQVVAGRLKLTLRELDDANAELDRRAEVDSRNKAREVDRQKELVRSTQDADRQQRAREDQARHDGEQREIASHRRRTTIQEIKQQVLAEPGAWLWPHAEAKASALLEVERALSALQVDELPREEMLIIARTARDKVYTTAKLADDETRELERNEHARAQDLAQRKCNLIQQAKRFARRELGTVEDLNGLERLRIEFGIERELQSINGDELWSEIEDRVEEILESEGIGSEELEDDT